MDPVEQIFAIFSNITHSARRQAHQLDNKLNLLKKSKRLTVNWNFVKIRTSNDNPETLGRLMKNSGDVRLKCFTTDRFIQRGDHIRFEDPAPICWHSSISTQFCKSLSGNALKWECPRLERWTFPYQGFSVVAADQTTNSFFASLSTDLYGYTEAAQSGIINYLTVQVLFHISTLDLV